MSELKHVYSLSSIFRKAWGIARHLAKHGGGSVRLYFAQALRQSWAEAKATAQRTAEERARVAACIAEIKARNLIAGPAQPLRPIPGFSEYGRRSYGYRRAA